jgi:hypothetical protein
LKALLLADADLRFAIVRGLRKLEPAVDFLPAQGVIRESLEDQDVLVLAANLESPGIVLIPQLCPLG